MSLKPKVSVLIPTYRYARFLREAIESVLQQRFSDYELIVSDDASDDGSAEIIAHYARQDPRICGHVHAANLGMVANWNWCLRRARGEYVKFVFGDDRLMHPHALGGMVELLEREPRASLAASARLILDEHSIATDVWDDLGRSGYYPGTALIRACLVLDRNLVGEPSAVLFRRSAAGRGFDPSLRQLVDLEMWFHLLCGAGLVYTSERLCAFRRHARQQTVVNQRHSVGEVENLLVATRYHEHLAAARGCSADSWAFRRYLFRRLYYSRKDRRRAGVAALGRSSLEPHLGAFDYWFCWTLHRLSKPAENLARRLRRAGGLGRRSVRAEKDRRVGAPEPVAVGDGAANGFANGLLGREI